MQLLSDELSEVSDDLKLTVQFLSDDFAAISEQKSTLSSKNRRFVFVCAYKMAAPSLVFNDEKMKITYLKVIILSPTAAIASAKLSSYSS